MNAFALTAARALAVLMLGALVTLDEAADLWAAGKRAEAVALLDAELSSSPDDAALRLRLAESLIDMRQYEAAAETAEPLGAAGNDVRGPALYVLSRYDEALPLLDRDDPLDILMVLDALTAVGRLDDVEKLLDHAATVRGDDDAAVLIHRGHSFARRGEHARAVVVFERAVTADPISAAALYGLGSALVRSGRRVEGMAKLEEHRDLAPKLDALEHAQRGLDFDPTHAANHGALGDAQRALGWTERAAASYARGFELATESSDAVPIALRWARLLVEDADDAEGAIELLDTAWSTHRDLRLIVRAGDVLADVGRTDEALARYDTALGVAPNQKAILQRRDQAAKRR